MTKTDLPAVTTHSFESLKQSNEHGAEYWSARELQPLLGYSQWRRFEQAIERAITSCETSGNQPANHFAGAGKMVDLGSGSQRQVEDYRLSRFACYLIAQNGDPRKAEIAHAQKYFAVQARRQELSDQAAADMKRLELRKQTSRPSPARRKTPGSRARCSASFTTLATGGFTADSGAMPSNSARQYPKRTACSTA